MPTRKFTYIDLFSGSGGFSLGFDMAGYKNVFSVEYDHGICETYRHNFPDHTLMECDIASLTESDILKLVGKKKVDVVIGGPPCQGFSMAGNIGRKFVDDPRNHLFQEFVRIVKIVSPTCFVMENVISLRKMGNWSFFIALMSVVRTIVYLTKAMLVIILVFVIAGLFSKVLALVFEEAVRYKEENDLTI